MQSRPIRPPNMLLKAAGCMRTSSLPAIVVGIFACLNVPFLVVRIHLSSSSRFHFTGGMRLARLFQCICSPVTLEISISSVLSTSSLVSSCHRDATRVDFTTITVDLNDGFQRHRRVFVPWMQRPYQHRHLCSIVHETLRQDFRQRTISVRNMDS